LYENNRLVNITIDEISLNGEPGTMLEKSLTFPSAPNSEYQIKAFLWDNINNAAPIAVPCVKDLEL
jgi:hypothetical protein